MCLRVCVCVRACVCTYLHVQAQTCTNEIHNCDQVVNSDRQECDLIPITEKLHVYSCYSLLEVGLHVVAYHIVLFYYFHTAGVDYVPTFETLVFDVSTPFDNCVSISVLPDDRVEDDETLLVKLLVSTPSVTVGNEEALIIILDNDGEFNDYIGLYELKYELSLLRTDLDLPVKTAILSKNY